MLALELFTIWLRPLSILLAPFAAAWYVTRRRPRAVRVLAYVASMALVLASAYPVVVIVVEEMRLLTPPGALIIDGQRYTVLAASLPDVPYSDLVISKANQYGIDPAIALAVVEVESNFNAAIPGAAGEIGLMQLMPGTAADLGVTNRANPAQDVDGGVRYLAQQLHRFGNYQLALAAYNGGPGAVGRGQTPASSIQYANKVLAAAEKYRTMLAQSQSTPSTGSLPLPYPAGTSYRLVNNGYHGAGEWPGRDWIAPCGTLLLSPIDGRVVRSGRDTYCGPFGCGNTYLLISDGNTEIMFMHGLYYSARPGTELKRGQVFGETSSQGNSSECHEHIGIRIGGRQVDPLEVIR